MITVICCCFFYLIIPLYVADCTSVFFSPFLTNIIPCRFHMIKNLQSMFRFPAIILFCLRFPLGKW